LDLAKVCNVKGLQAASIFFKSLLRKIKKETKKFTTYLWQYGIFIDFNSVENVYKAFFRAVVQNFNIETNVQVSGKNSSPSNSSHCNYCTYHQF
jgi:ferritin